jgi:hypothetical protein
MPALPPPSRRPRAARRRRRRLRAVAGAGAGLGGVAGRRGLVLLRLSKDGRQVRAPEPCLQPLDVTTRAAYGGAPTVSGAGCCDGRACVPRAQLVSCSDDCELRLCASGHSLPAALSPHCPLSPTAVSPRRPLSELLPTTTQAELALISG